MVITLIGSTRFMDSFRSINERLSRAGHAVFSVACSTYGVSVSCEDKAVLDAVHISKMALSSAVVCINPGGYVGDSTASELRFAMRCGIPVYYSDTGGWGRSVDDLLSSQASQKLNVYSNVAGCEFSDVTADELLSRISSIPGEGDVVSVEVVGDMRFIQFGKVK